MAILHKAIQEAQTPPCGPVSVEIPIDIQSAKIPLSLLTAPLKRAPAVEPEASLVDALWAQQAGEAAAAVAWRRRVRERRGGEDAGGCRGDGDFQYPRPRHSGGQPSRQPALVSYPSVEALISQCDFTLVAGSRLRSNETRSWTLELPTPRVQIDIDPAAASLLDGQYPVADCRALLAALAARVQGRIWGDARWDSQLKEAVEAAEQGCATSAAITLN